MNIKQIAKQAGVSVATVSRVLNHPESVAPETKEKIERIMQEAEYTPNWFARGLNFNKTKTIGLMIPHILNPANMEIVKGVEDVARQKDYITFMCNVENDPEKERQYAESLIHRKVDGIILISSHLEADEIENIYSQGVPVVMIGENKGKPNVPVVRTNCQQAIFKAVNYLMEVGYRKIAILYGKTPELENKRKIEGYEQALAKEGIERNPAYIIATENNIEGGYLGAKRFIEMQERPEVILATSDLIAFGVMDAMKDHNIRMPEEISIIGFDNIRMSNMVDPKLTTIEKPLHKMGVVGARLLFDMIEDADQKNQAYLELHRSKEIELQSKIKIRKSCGHTERLQEMFRG
ncbi:LacI family DNA-binding transcriptional regulator [Clostridium aminobutyricum]|uniref:LacI family DNA-binding transcriptional regulator n=1 Tax=Clostridium aminobutyricum TaxID=33953 RepID=A0A939D9F6_CLOAM|nr:LacI family DNA-binding transcriptional regulator [Clostridium aminobutyricum]MBN7773656.1 LacI family DNA-binding transcriptional regulator [Clostridium aminobutyricum]